MTWLKRVCALFFLILCFFSSAQAENRFAFVVFGDNQGNVDVFDQVINRINGEPGIVLALNVGDFTQGGKKRDYQQYIRQASKIKAKTYNAMGNHDAAYGGWKNYEKYFGNYYYAFDYANARFIVLNNAFAESFTNTQLVWLKNVLGRNRKEHTFVFMHRPLFDPSGYFSRYCMQPVSIAEELAGLFSRYKINMVFAGHIHGFLETQKEGVKYIITGGAGAALHLPSYEGGFHHYIKVDIDADKVYYKIVKVNTYE